MTASPSGHDRDATNPAGSNAQPVLEGGTFHLGDRVVNRLGFGAMQLTGRESGASPPTGSSASGYYVGRSSSASTSSTPPTPTVPRSARSSSTRRSTPIPTDWSSPPRPASPVRGPASGRRSGDPSTCASSAR